MERDDELGFALLNEVDERLHFRFKLVGLSRFYFYISDWCVGTPAVDGAVCCPVLSWEGAV